MEITQLSIRDVLFVDSVLKNPEIWEACRDDGYPEPGQWTSYGRLQNPDNYFLMPSKNGRAAGVIIFYKRNSFCWDTHVAILPEFRGRFVVEAYKEAFRWMFEKSPALKVKAWIPAYNLAAITLARAVGMQKEGRGLGEWKKNGKLYDVLYFGLRKEVAP